MQTSSGERLFNILNAPSFEEVEGYIGLDCPWVSLSVSLCVGYACTRSITIEDKILDFRIWINHANEMAI